MGDLSASCCPAGRGSLERTHKHTTHIHNSNNLIHKTAHSPHLYCCGTSQSSTHRPSDKVRRGEQEHS